MQVVYVGAPPKQSILVTIYYWEHDQSEERPLEEFFRGEASSLVQWQPPPAGGLAVAGMPMHGVPVQLGGGYGGGAYPGVRMGGGGGMEAGMCGDGGGGCGLDLSHAASMLNGVRALLPPPLLLQAALVPSHALLTRRQARWLALCISSCDACDACDACLMS
jgi:hypothetical protein